MGVFLLQLWVYVWDSATARFQLASYGFSFITIVHNYYYPSEWTQNDWEWISIQIQGSHFICVFVFHYFFNDLVGYCVFVCVCRRDRSSPFSLYRMITKKRNNILLNGINFDSIDLDDENKTKAFWSYRQKMCCWTQFYGFLSLALLKLSLWIWYFMSFLCIYTKMLDLINENFETKHSLRKIGVISFFLECVRPSQRVNIWMRMNIFALECAFIRDHAYEMSDKLLLQPHSHSSGNRERELVWMRWAIKPTKSTILYHFDLFQRCFVCICIQFISCSVFLRYTMCSCSGHTNISNEYAIMVADRWTAEARAYFSQRLRCIFFPAVYLCHHWSEYAFLTLSLSIS